MKYTPLQIAKAQGRCDTKLHYDSWDEAEVAARCLLEDLQDGKLRWQKSGNIMAYKCSYCPHWHVGHSTAHVVRRALTPTGTEGWQFWPDLLRAVNVKSGGNSRNDHSLIRRCLS